MSRHLTFNDLIAYQHGQLTNDQKHRMEQHLAGCSHCSQNADLLRTEAEAEETPARHTNARGETAASACLSAEEISMFLNGELSFWAARKTEKHLALCEACRQKLAEIIRASAAPLNKEEKARVTAYSKLVIAEQLRVIEELGQVKNRFNWKAWVEQIRKWFTPFLPLKLAWLIVILAMVGIWLGQRSLRQWQATKHLAVGFALLQDTYSVSKENLLPHGFAPSMFSGVRGDDAASNNISEIEQHFQTALSWDERNREAKRGLAQYSYFKRDYASAHHLLSVLLKEDSTDFAAWNDFGVVAAQRKDTTAALTAFDKALSLEPHDETVAHNLALLVRRLGNNFGN